MPKKRDVDQLARKLSFAGLEENGGQGVKHVNNSHKITRLRKFKHGINDTGIDNVWTEWPDSVESTSESEIGGVFPKAVYFILAVIATSFLFSRTIQNLFSYSLTDILYPLIQSMFLGLLCVVISWMVTFSDSLEPGSNPPSPISPQKFRKRSGHTFHSSYVICIANGVVAFVVSLWYLSK
ncbi:putative ADP-ribosylation factor-like protein 6-interacting protein 6-like [Apostichopus japonicus]|uniref:Putative ADP-ribosylation factor-like protein 6-interacting protein 6-like n=1 Tax=Stichopus japonicus TaxID=307972 RepID=A0A2G8LBC5_STIJA|nr:putative ADP-ribosylation factor-like protein 6-interacting protein 6-like [Apostichopus japonicus]